MTTLEKHFEGLTEAQFSLFTQLEQTYQDWNQKINLISRKDIHNFRNHHLLHALAIAKVFKFKPGASILDLGTGGGIPGIPLAILFPDTQFTLIDGKGKKIMVVNDICDQLGISNVKGRHIRAEELREKFDFVICRAVASLPRLYEWSEKLVKQNQQHAFPNGLIALKGGNVKEEIDQLPRGSYYEIFPLSDFYDLPYYEEKYVIYVQL